jgi:hypothetical protein
LKACSLLSCASKQPFIIYKLIRCLRAGLVIMKDMIKVVCVGYDLLSPCFLLNDTFRHCNLADWGQILSSQAQTHKVRVFSYSSQFWIGMETKNSNLYSMRFEYPRGSWSLSILIPLYLHTNLSCIWYFLLKKRVKSREQFCFNNIHTKKIDLIVVFVPLVSPFCRLIPLF